MGLRTLIAGEALCLLRENDGGEKRDSRGGQEGHPSSFNVILGVCGPRV